MALYMSTGRGQRGPVEMSVQHSFEALLSLSDRALNENVPYDRSRRLRSPSTRKIKVLSYYAVVLLYCGVSVIQGMDVKPLPPP